MATLSSCRPFIFVPLGLSIVAFAFFGWFHLGQFETTDEHLWKYDRIGTYWEAWGDRAWEKTYINDKPGVTVALISGISLLAEPHPEENEKHGQINSADAALFEQYNVAQSELTNIRFRLPILAFATLSLLVFFFLASRALHSSWAALFSTLFITFSPILIGISQIINPDSLFWIFGGLGALAYMALLRTGERKFIFWCGILTGFALLSKYTAFILFLFYFIFLASTFIFRDSAIQKDTDFQRILQSGLNLGLIFLLAITVFSLFLPAVFVKPEYLFKGIGQFFSEPKLSAVAIGLAALGLVGAALYRYTEAIIASFVRQKRIILTAVSTLFLILIAASILNAWTKQSLSSVDALRDAAYANEPQAFNFKPVLDRKVEAWTTPFKLLLLEAAPLVFSLSPILFLILGLAALQSWRKRLPEHIAQVTFSILLFTLLYLFAAYEAKVVTNARYLILLYPLLALLAGSVLAEWIERQIPGRQQKILLSALFIIIFTGFATVFSVRPFYFSYTNFLLPQEFSVHDSWGHGSYEAAEYLNALPDAENLIIWSNSDTVCRFFEGKCLRSRRIDLNRSVPDYFVFSKRGVTKTRNHFILVNNPNPKRDASFYIDRLDEDAVWSIDIGDRSSNFIKIIPFKN